MPSSRPSSPPQVGLSDAQVDLLWELARTPRLEDHLDGRTLSPLVARGLVVVRRGWAEATNEGREMSGRQIRALTAKASGRAASVLKAVGEIQGTVRGDQELLIAGMAASVDDILLALIRAARAMDADTP